MKEILTEKIKESLLSVLPIALLVIILSLTIAGIEAGTIVLFVIGALMLVLGMSLFTFGADVAMMPIGQGVGAFLAKKRNMLFVVLLIGFVIGLVITIAEPDLHVLAGQLSTTDSINYTLLLSVAVGVGFFLAVSIIRTFFKIKLRYIILICYLIMFILAIFFVPKEFISVAFDSGGVTTGPITVPFFMAFGFGLTAMGKSGNENKEDSFGTIALCSIGPILAVMILGMTGLTKAGYDPVDHVTIESASQIFRLLGNGLARTMGEVAIALGAIIVVFILFQIFALKMPKAELKNIIVGFIITYAGLTIFLTGVNVGFMPMGKLLGGEIALKSYKFILIPLGMLMGCLIVLAEPAIHILNKQVEEITNGAISKRLMLVCLSIGVALAIGLAMIRVLTGISIWWFLIPAYGISIILMFFVPPMITGIAFDSGGVASGPMTATFLLPFAMGTCIALDGNVMANAFGLVAFVAMMPILTVQLLGFIYRIKIEKLEKVKECKQKKRGLKRLINKSERR